MVRRVVTWIYTHGNADAIAAADSSRCRGTGWWEVAVILQRRPLLQARFLGLVGMTCKLLHEEVDTVYEPNSLGRLINTRVRRV